MIEGHQLGLPGGSPRIGENNPARLGAHPPPGKPGLPGLGGLGAQARAGGVPANERRGSILSSPDLRAGSAAMEGFIQDWLKSKDMAKDMLPEAWKQLGLSADALAMMNPLQAKESAPTATSAPEPATKTSTYNRRAWEIAYAARLAAIDAAAEAAARATSSLSSTDSSTTSPAEDTESAPVVTTIAVTPTEENGEGGTSTGGEESSSDPAPESGGADGTGETEDGSEGGKIRKHGKHKGESK